MPPVSTYDEALTYLAQFINYESQQPVAYQPEHFNVQAFADFLQTLGAPHQAFPTVHIAGSKGKGSTAAMVAAILSQAGWRTGLATSPHLVTIRERTQIDRQPISREAFATLVGELQAQVDGTPLVAHARRMRTFFELTTALTFVYFARHKVDIAVVEVGLGGRLDTTNVLTPQVVVLTPIGLEHTRLLGDTLAAIAGEKAGIIKPHSCVVSAAQAPEVVEVFERRCQEQEATLLLAGRDFHWQTTLATCYGSRLEYDGGGQALHDLTLPLLGRHQVANAAVALTVVQQLQRQGWAITETHMRQGLAKVRWEGRLEVLSRAPWVVLDGAHTVEAATALTQALTELWPGQRVHLILGIATDKNIPAIIATLATVAHEVTVTRFNSPRAAEPQHLADLVRQHSRTVQIEPDPVVALAHARSQAQFTDVVCITGSLLLVGEVKARLQGLAPEF